MLVTEVIFQGQWAPNLFSAGVLPWTLPSQPSWTGTGYDLALTPDTMHPPVFQRCPKTLDQ